MLAASLLPPGTPAWMRLTLEAVSLFLAARVVLNAVRRSKAGVLALAAAAWVWFFYPPGHAWMAAEGLRLLVWARGVVPSVLASAHVNASMTAAALASGTAGHRGGMTMQDIVDMRNPGP